MISFKRIVIALFILIITVSTSNASHHLQAASRAGFSLKINEFMADNATTLPDPADPTSYPDWIELYNNGAIPVDLKGLYLTDDLSNLTQFQINESIVLGPQEFVLFYADNDPEEGARHTNFKLSSDGEAIALVDTDGVTILDNYTFGAQKTDRSEGRSPDGSDHWRIFDTPTPNSSNPQSIPPLISNTSHQPTIPTDSQTVTVNSTITDDRAVTSATLYYSTGGDYIKIAMNSLGNSQYEAIIPALAKQTQVTYYVTAQDDEALVTLDPSNAPTNNYGYTVGYTPPALYLNEFMANNQNGLSDPVEPDEYPDWIELYNAGSSPIDLKGYHLTDDLLNLTQYQITETLIIQPQSFLLFYADNDPEQGVEHTNFALSQEGESLTLVDQSGFMIIDSYTFGPQSANLSLGRFPDSSNNWLSFSRSTPNESNNSGLALSNKIFLPLIANE